MLHSSVHPDYLYRWGGVLLAVWGVHTIEGGTVSSVGGTISYVGGTYCESAVLTGGRPG